MKRSSYVGRSTVENLQPACKSHDIGCIGPPILHSPFSIPLLQLAPASFLIHPISPRRHPLIYMHITGILLNTKHKCCEPQECCHCKLPSAALRTSTVQSVRSAVGAASMIATADTSPIHLSICSVSPGAILQVDLARAGLRGRIGGHRHGEFLGGRELVSF